MANTMQGKVYMVMPTETIQGKTKSFTKRVLVLDCTEERNGFTFQNFPSFEFMGDRCSLLDSLQVGQVVNISFDLRGTKFSGSDGKERYFTSITGYKVDLNSAPVQQATPPQAMPLPPAPAPQANENGIDPLPF